MILYADSEGPDQSAELYSLIGNFAIRHCILQHPMILYADSEGPDQSAELYSLIGNFCNTSLYFTAPNDSIRGQ